MFQFNAEAIFEIGVQIEKNGKAFYLEAVKSTSDKMLKSLFTELAEWEDKHVELFQQLQAELPDNMRQDNIFDPEDEMMSYLKAAADSHVFVVTSDIARLFREKCHSPVDILDMALAFEKDSVVYYTTVKKAVAEHFGQKQIDLLIDEELSHISLLNAKKKQLAK